MRRNRLALCLVAALILVVFLPFPTKVSQGTRAQVEFADGRPVAGLKVVQGWECFGLSGEGRDEGITDASGVVRFPSRFGYGSAATRALGRLFRLIAVHASYGANVRLEFYFDDPFRAVFNKPLFKPLEPFSTSGSYLDAGGRDYFPQENGRRQYVSVTGDFLRTTGDIKIIVTRRDPH